MRSRGARKPEPFSPYRHAKARLERCLFASAYEQHVARPADGRAIAVGARLGGFGLSWDWWRGVNKGEIEQGYSPEHAIGIPDSRGRSGAPGAENRRNAMI